MTTKITKSELKLMIREALREELRLHEAAEASSNSELSNILSDALDGARHAYADNVLVRFSGNGHDELTAIRAWAKENGVRVFFVSALDTEFFEYPDTDKIRGAVLVIDQLDRARPKDKAALFADALVEHAWGQLFTVACVKRGVEMSTAETRLFTYQYNA